MVYGVVYENGSESTYARCFGSDDEALGFADGISEGAGMGGFQAWFWHEEEIEHAGHDDDWVADARKKIAALKKKREEDTEATE